MQHDRWLDWKLKHGLAVRGKTGGPLQPSGLLAGLLYKFYYSKTKAGKAAKLDAAPKVFKQKVHGKVGPSGGVHSG